MNMHRKQIAVAVGTLMLTLSGCASLDIDQAIDMANVRAKAFTGGNLQLARTDEQRSMMRARADALLEEELGLDQAIELALANSPALQALLARSWESGAAIAQSGSLPNPVFTFERVSGDDDLDITRVLGIGLLDILTYPQRSNLAERDIERVKLTLIGDVVSAVTRVRQDWVAAVTAKQLESYAEQVRETADASAELASRMESVGNFNRLSRLRQQVFYADAVTALANARHAATAARETLVRTLGLTVGQAEKLTLPATLPQLPGAPRSASDVANAASEGRLDVGIAQLALQRTARAEGYDFLTGVTDIEIAGVSETKFAEGESETGTGYEFEARLPLFGVTSLRDRLNARTLASVNELEQVTREASSSLREAYSAYRTAWDIAQHYRSEVLPLRQGISEEMQLEYNGMIIGVFELLADARTSVDTAVAAIRAEEQFWLASAALDASIIGKPTLVDMAMGPVGDGGGGDAGH